VIYDNIYDKPMGDIDVRFREDNTVEISKHGRIYRTYPFTQEEIRFMWDYTQQDWEDFLIKNQYDIQ